LKGVGFVPGRVVEVEVEVEGGLDLGWEKKEVMAASALGFLAASAARSTALRLRDMLMDAVQVRRERGALGGVRSSE